MEIRTKITELLGIKYPIIQGGLQGLGREPLVSAVSAAGGLGLITAGSYPSKKEMIEDIERVRTKTNNPFGVNVAIGLRKPMDEYVDGIVETGVKIVFTSGYSPKQYMEQFKKAGIKVIHVVPNLKFAKKAEELGCDGTVIVGYEGGGHPGLDDVSTLVKLPQIVEAVDIPVIATGGFSDGKGLITALSLGAEGIQMGTRFVMTKETPISEKIQALLLQANSDDTSIIKRSINKPARVFKSDAATRVLEMESKKAPIDELLTIIGGEAYEKVIKDGDIDAGVISIGQVIGRIHDLPSAQELIENIMKEAEETLNHLNSLCIKALK